MPAKKILYPTDFSHTGDAALAMATSLARDLNAVLLFVHVEEHPGSYGGGEAYYGVAEPSTEKLKEMLTAVRPTQPDVACEHRLITGRPAAAILQLAADENVDMIVTFTEDSINKC